MQRLELARASLTLPQACACCLGPATDSVPTQKTKRLFLGVASVNRSLSLDVPYCQTCSRHVLWSEGGGIPSMLIRAVIVLLATGFVGVLLALLLTQVLPALVAGVGPREGLSKITLLVLPLLSCGMPLVVAGLFVRRRLGERPERAGAGHSRERHAVEVLDFREDRLTLGVWNERYAALLTRLRSA